MKVYIARDKDGRLFKYPYWTGMLATEIPHKHMCAYPFDGNHIIFKAKIISQRKEKK